MSLQKSRLDLLNYWHKIEFFLPFELDKDNIGIPVFCNDDLPWVRGGVKLDDEEEIQYYRVYLGLFFVSEAKEAITRYFGGKADLDPNAETAKTCICELKCRANGEYVEDSLKFSTFPWAVGKLLANQLHDPKWMDDFYGYARYAKISIEQLINHDATFERLHEAVQILLEAMGWYPQTMSMREADNQKLPPVLVTVKTKKKPKDAVKTKIDQAPSCDEAKTDQQRDVYWGQEDDDEIDLEKPEIEILNSFYVRDLEQVIDAVIKDDIGEGLRRYLDGDPGDERINLSDLDELKKILRPDGFVSGKWPFDVSKPLNLMQQTAVHLILEELEEESGIFSINGPPGTGKTTLLRDVIAAIVTRRAERMISYRHPQDAFGPPSTFKAEDSSSFKYYIYPPKANIIQDSIVIASSNNGAVENVTKELPDLKAIEGFEDHPEAAYFPETARLVSGLKERWGMISAALGKSENCWTFAQMFWLQEKDPKTDELLPTMRYFLNDKAPSVKLWSKAKQEFVRAKQKVEQIVADLKEWEAAFHAREQFRVRREALERERADWDEKQASLERRIARLERDLELVQSNVRQQKDILDTLKQRIPWSVRLLFWTRRAKEYRRNLETCERACLEAYRTWEQLRMEYEQSLKERDVVLEQQRRLAVEWEEVNRCVQHLETDLARLAHIEEEVLDESFWKQERDNLQKSAPWFSKRLSQARAELFLCALQVHRAFIAEAKKQIRNNLNALMWYLTGQIPFIRIQPHLQDVWNTFFLVVPVVSTTFASVSRLFRGLGKESIGWLIVDEAGQAVPQAAVGALWRAKRAIVVGDPLQIEPVVTIPDCMVEHFRIYYGISPEITDKTCSVQTLADRANRYGTWLGGENAKWVGAPLFVHRRCLNPMFEIANRVSYNQLMVYATSPPRRDHFPLGTSRWIDVRGEVDGKHWVPEQGQVVKQLVREAILASLAENELPDLYVISPFTEVSYNNKKELESLYDEFRGYVRKKDFYRWIRTHVGTVHTFQGKEAQTVIFCLGLDETTKGAATWASRSPNILNVAVTRAKYRLIIVGSKAVWGTLPYFDTALAVLNEHETKSSGK